MSHQIHNLHMTKHITGVYGSMTQECAVLSVMNTSTGGGQSQRSGERATPGRGVSDSSD